jgi:hypothetical protein
MPQDGVQIMSVPLDVYEEALADRRQLIERLHALRAAFEQQAAELADALATRNRFKHERDEARLERDTAAAAYAELEAQVGELFEDEEWDGKWTIAKEGDDAHDDAYDDDDETVQG